MFTFNGPVFNQVRFNHFMPQSVFAAIESVCLVAPFGLEARLTGAFGLQTQLIAPFGLEQRLAAGFGLEAELVAPFGLESALTGQKRC